MPKGAFVEEGTLTLPYEQLRTVHNGSSEVRVGRNRRTDSPQVVKTLSLLGRESTVAVTEAVLLREMDHPNIAEVHEVAEPAGCDPTLDVVSLVMPYYERGSILDALERDERFTVGESRDLALRALRALEHIHDRHRVLHRDIKSPNLFLTADQSALKLGDFGEALRMDHAGCAEPLPSPQIWTPPESFAHSWYGVPSELYSLGVVLHEMLSGPLPYEDFNPDKAASRLSAGKPALEPRFVGPRSHRPHVPPDLRRIVNKATAPEPERRYAHASEMVGDLLGARFVDWRWPESADDVVTWHGTLPGPRGSQALRVVAWPVQRKGWRARAETVSGNTWRRLYRSPIAHGDDSDQAAEHIFRHIDQDRAKA